MQKQESHCVIIEESVFSRFSGLQKKILLELSNGPLGLNELSERTGSSVYTIGKQLSLLQLRTKYNSLEKKGISKPLVAKHKDAGVKTTYFLAARIPRAEQ